MLTGFFCGDSPYLLLSRIPDGPDCEDAGHIFNILGWGHAVRGKKAEGFSLEMQALGIQPNLVSLWRSESTVQNKPQRRDRNEETASNPSRLYSERSGVGHDQLLLLLREFLALAAALYLAMH